MKKPGPFGKYFLLERINVGGMAEVFRAKAFGVEGFERLVAVKRILANIAEDKEFIRMFIDEAKLAVQLNHANIAQIFDLGVVDGAYYIALEHVHGRDLRAVFDRCRQINEPMAVAQACFVAMKLCEGLDYAHNKRDQAGREIGLVHRDVSPQNVLVSFEGEVKIIDFGIAKAAGKGSKTQAGILKGKFGYMSPEQVRGLPIDRRSDVFSCGIVLYELLTGERLFVGESDFSTLEKVRNVEILPPSTYNRKIPDELERIVLKALAKDVEDRYQNAIDLHDELQAFVYTAGEFYSRKDLAGWMKKTFSKEIEEETAKLESYRQLKPPASMMQPESPAVARTATGGGKPPVQTAQMRKTTQALPAVAGNMAKPPPPPRTTQQVAAVGSTQPPPLPSASQSMPIVGKAAAAAVAAPAPKFVAKPVAPNGSNDLSWDDDELETQIYDNPEDDPKLKQRAPSKSGAPSASPSMMAAQSDADGGPDLSSLVSTAKGWDAAGNATNPSLPQPPSNLANGSNKVPSPLHDSGVGFPGGPPPPIVAISASSSAQFPAPGTLPPPFGARDTGSPFSARDTGPPFGARESAVPSRLVSASEPVFDPMGNYSGAVRREDRKSGIVMYAVIGAAVAVVGIVVFIATRSSGNKPDNKPVVAATQPGSAQAPVTPPAPPVAAVGDQNTGFDLYVSPGGVTQWRLDGEARSDRLPSRIRGIAPGPHNVSIDAPPGFMSQSQQVAVEVGKSSKVEITLPPIQGITGTFESEPPGATVTLIVDGKRQALGPSPAKVALDPRLTYQVLFERPGYVSVNKPITFSGSLEEKVSVNLEKAGTMISTGPVTNPPVNNPPVVAVTNPPVTHPDRPVTHPVDHPRPPVDHPVTPEKPPVDHPVTPDKPPVVAAAMGTLVLGSKPPCDIFIDGSSTGMHTPQRAIPLKAGKHKVTLMNGEFGIKESFTVDIKPDEPTKEIKDFSDKMTPP